MAMPFDRGSLIFHAPADFAAEQDAEKARIPVQSLWVWGIRIVMGQKKI